MTGAKTCVPPAPSLQQLESSLEVQLQRARPDLSAASKLPMAAPSGGDDDGLFVKLKRADPKVLEERQKAVNERVHATFEKSQQRLADLLEQNSTLPTTISSITVLGAPNTRRAFLERIFNPLLSVNRDRPLHSVGGAPGGFDTSAEAKQIRFVSFRYHSRLLTHCHRVSTKSPYHFSSTSLPNTDPSTTPTDLAVFLSVKEKGWIQAKTGTESRQR